MAPSRSPETAGTSRPARKRWVEYHQISRSALNPGIQGNLTGFPWRDQAGNLRISAFRGRFWWIVPVTCMATSGVGSISETRSRGPTTPMVPPISRGRRRGVAPAAGNAAPGATYRQNHADFFPSTLAAAATGSVAEAPFRTGFPSVRPIVLRQYRQPCLASCPPLPTPSQIRAGPRYLRVGKAVQPGPPTRIRRPAARFFGGLPRKVDIGGGNRYDRGMWTIIRGALGCGLAFGAERGAELMWPDESPWMWWSIAGAIAILWVGLELVHRRRKRSPEIRLNDTTTYREQADGSRIVTQTTLARPVHISGVLTIEGGASADPPTLTKPTENRGE